MISMNWSIEYFEQADTSQPAEIFEDALVQSQPKLAGKLLRIAVALQSSGHQLGGGLIEPCHGYHGLWEMRTIQNAWLAREFFGFDNQRIILLHGYVKRTGQPASTTDLDKASLYWKDYQKTRKISPILEEENESL